MARILYGVQGDHNGHLRRALSVADLLPGHQFLFVGGGNTLRARNYGHEVEEFPVMGTVVRNNQVRPLATFGGMLSKRLNQDRHVGRLAQIIRNFDPHLIISDYEYYSPRAALALGRPCYSLDHTHVIARTRYRLEPDQPLSGFISRALMNTLLPGMSGFIMISFHRPPPLDPARDALFGPLPHADVLNMKAAKGEHVCMYLPDCNPDKVAKLFGGRKRRECRAYGMGALPERGNVKFLAPDREGFLKDLASSAYAVCCAGHGTLTEALLFGKACLCFPGNFLYEQLWNSHFIRQNGYGDYFTSFDIDSKAIADFESSLESCTIRIRAGNFNDREALRTYLQGLLR